MEVSQVCSHFLTALTTTAGEISAAQHGVERYNFLPSWWKPYGFHILFSTFVERYSK